MSDRISNGIRDTRIDGYTPLITPNELLKELHLSDAAKTTVKNGRDGIEHILDKSDDRMILVVGPCSVHDINEAKLYADKLKKLADQVNDQFLIVMRTFFEKPRTTTGWTGLMYDPGLDGTFDMNQGLRLARELLVYNAEIGLLSGTEFVDPRLAQYTSDAISWAAVGARTAESQIHRHMASGRSMPVGFKNSTDGNVKIAIDAVKTARQRHCFLGMDMDGVNARVETKGNPYTHIILRGGEQPNYDSASVESALAKLRDACLPEIIMVDCSHGNSQKDHHKQPYVFTSMMQQRMQGNEAIIGVMIESYINGGNQNLPADLLSFDQRTLRQGVSVTDKCLDWKATEDIILDGYRQLKGTKEAA
jgi:3-deoxy-7-phosphoheptulonate synthase